MTELIVLTGPPGAGKSTVASLLVDLFEPGALVIGDEFFGFLRRGFIEPWKPEAHAQNEIVISAAASAAGQYVKGGINTIYDGIVGPWLIQEFARAANTPRLHYAILLPSEECCIERALSRTNNNFKDVAGITHMHRHFSGANVDSRHLITETFDAPEETARLVQRRVRDNSLRYVCADAE